ncbi:MAG: 50S ribosomal protein L33 [Candidatus Spechtbacteria bacterium]|nr:50S ribosomal protein L33 [Candidatus Spechtbacteria bacterium]
MSQDNLIKLQCSKCSNVNYWSSKNKKKVERKLEYMKFCKECGSHTKHSEGKKKGK